MNHEQLMQCSGKMLGYLRKCFPYLDDADRENAVQTVLASVIARGADFMPSEAALATYLCKAAFYAAQKLWKKRERAWFEKLDAQPRVDVTDNAAPTPSAIRAETERRERQGFLLSDVFEQYTRHCEVKNMQTQREIYERRLRGQEVAQIEAALRMTRNNIDQHLKRARDWINERMQQSDVHGSVFQTFLQPRRDMPVLTASMPAHVPRDFFEVLQRVVNEAGALCPSDERFARYEAQSFDVEFSDLRYHIEEVPCALCQARRALSE